MPRSFRLLHITTALVLAVLQLTGCGDGADAACLGLEYENCRDNSACEAIPYWGESLVACNVDDRGFGNNCPFEGCRPQDSNCPSLTELVDSCDQYCPYNSFSIDPATGCRECACRTDG